MDSAKAVSVGRADGSSVSRTVLNLLMSAVGTGVFLLPGSFSRSGFVAAMPLLVVTWSLSQYMMSLLYKCMLSLPGTRSYTDLGFAAGGRLGQLAVSVAMYSGLGAICVGMILLMSSAVTSMDPAFTDGKDKDTDTEIMNRYKFVSAAIMGLLALLPSFKEVGILSAVGVFALVVTLISVVVGSAILFAKESPTVEASPMNFMEVCGTFNLFMNGFTVAPVIPSLVLDMREPMRFNRVLTVGFACIAFVFLLIGFTYIGLGDDKFRIPDAVPVTELIIKSKHVGVCGTFIQWGTVVICVCHFLCLFAPIAGSTDNLIIGHLTKSAPNTLKHPLRVFLLTALGRLSVVALCLGTSFAIPKFGMLIDIVACTIVPLLQLVFPIWLFCVLRAEEAKQQFVYLIVSGVVGLFAVGVGLYLTFSNF